MDTLESVRKRLQDRNIAMVAKATGLHYNAVIRLARGQTSPQYETVRKVAEYLDRNP